MKTNLLMVMMIALTVITSAATVTSYGSGKWSSRSVWTQNKSGVLVVTSGSTAVTGVNTLFTTELSIGDILWDSTETAIGTVSSITDDVTLTLQSNAPASLTDAKYWKREDVQSTSLPASSDDIVISSGNSVTVDGAAVTCHDLTVNGNLYFAIVASGPTTLYSAANNGIIINGNVSVANGARFRMAANTPGSGSLTAHVELKGNLTVASGGTFDMRQASGAIGMIGRVVFSGSTNSTVTLSQTSYGSSIEEFNTVVINKTGGAKVILASGNLFLNNNSSNLPDTLIFTSGVVETQGTSVLVQLRTASAGVSGYSASSYVNGTIGVGISNTANNVSSRDFPVGDASTYRPITMQMVSPAVANSTGHYVWVKLVSGNANNGSSTLNGGIDKVNPARYYQMGYDKGASGAEPMKFSSLSPTYRADDGVAAGNTTLRVAYSTDARVNWNGNGPSAHTTSITGSPVTIKCDTVSPNISLTSGSSFFVALANQTGASSNPLPVELSSFAVSVKQDAAHLTWSTATEVNNAGFTVERRGTGEWMPVSFVKGAGSSNAAHSYSFADARLSAGRYEYRLKQTDRDGTVRIVSGVESAEIAAPKLFAITGNYPNPFNPSTTIAFTVAQDGPATLAVYDLVGREVARLFNGPAASGSEHRVEFNASGLASGLYFARLQSGANMAVRKMMLMK